MFRIAILGLPLALDFGRRFCHCTITYDVAPTLDKGQNLLPLLIMVFPLISVPCYRPTNMVSSAGSCEKGVNVR